MKTHSNAELGYWIAEAFWNQGFATEAIGFIIQLGFKQLQLSRIYPECHKNNPASIHVLFKNGFKEIEGNNAVALYASVSPVDRS